MRTACTKHMIELASSSESVIASIVRDATEVGVVVPSRLSALLQKIGATVTYHAGPGDDAAFGDARNGAWVQVRTGGTIVARAFSHDQADALLQAIYALLKEEAAAVA